MKPRGRDFASIIFCNRIFRVTRVIIAALKKSFTLQSIDPNQPLNSTKTIELKNMDEYHIKYTQEGDKMKKKNVSAS